MKRILALTKKEFLEIFRMQHFLPLLLFMPLLQVLIFGYVLTMDVKSIPIRVVNLSATSEAQEIVVRLLASPLFRVASVHGQPVAVEEILRKGEVKAVVSLRDQPGARSFGKTYPQIQLLLDGIDSNTSLVAAGYLNGIVQEFLLTDMARFGVNMPVEYRPLFRFNPSLRSINFMGPALVGILLTSLLLIVGSVAIVREKECQTIDSLLISPLRPLEIYIGKALPVALIALLSTGLGLGVITFWFGVPLRGSLFYLLLTLMLYVPAVLAFSMMISTLARTQQEAMFFAWFAMISFMMFSGFLTPVENMPLALRWITRANPTFYLMRIVRELFLKGNSISDFWPDLLALIVITVLVVNMSLLNYRRSIYR